MLRSALRISFQQALRSAALLILPLAFGALVIWATAGSGMGQTSDPLRASIWLWLAANHIPSVGKTADIIQWLSYLPLGSLFPIFLALRSGFLRASAKIQPDTRKATHQILLLISLGYALIATALSLLSAQSTLTFPWYFTFPITFIVSFVSTYIASELRPDHSHNKPWHIGVKYGVLTFLVLWAIATFVTALSLAFHFSDVTSLTTVIQPGIFGGITFLAIQILYLPNVTIATLSYLVGAGFTIGSGSLIHPLVHRLSEIPALPILGALPTQANPFALFAVIVSIALSAFTVVRIHRHFRENVQSQRAIQHALTAYLATNFLVAMTVGLLSMGSLFNRNLSLVGPTWFFAVVVTAELFVGVIASHILAKKYL